MKDVLKTGFILFLICAIAAFCLAMTNELTKDKIDEQKAIASEKAKKAVLPTAISFEALDDATLSDITANFAPVKEGFKGLDAEGQVVGYVFKSTPSGFGGDVEVITGLDLNDTVTGVRIGSHAETPGLGAKAVEPEFYEQYSGMSAAQMIGVSKTAPSDTDIQAITGATISSKAITKGVNASIDAYHSIVSK